MGTDMGVDKGKAVTMGVNRLTVQRKNTDKNIYKKVENICEWATS